jgi:hypothetical protein
VIFVLAKAMQPTVAHLDALAGVNEGSAGRRVYNSSGSHATWRQRRQNHIRLMSSMETRSLRAQFGNAQFIFLIE